MSSSHRPETDAALLERFALPRPSARLKILNEILRARTPVTFYAEQDEDFVFCSHLSQVSAKGGSLSLEGPADHASPPRPLPFHRFTAVALHTHIKLQFPLSLKSTTPDAVTGELVADLPDTLSRLQRRDAYRVSLSSDAATHLLLTRPGSSSTPRETRILDLSVTGLSFVLPDDFDRPKVGQEYPGARIALSTGTGPGAKQITALHCDLVVRRVSDMSGQEAGKQRIGCALLSLSGSSERALQVFLNAEQIRQRARRKVIVD
jgi:c-di-GMP-binding flagellar brake protein YcgR